MEQRIDFPVVFEETGRKSFNGTFQDNFGNYMGMYSLGFFFVTIWQVLAIVYDNLVRSASAPKSKKSAPIAKNVGESKAEEAERIYHAIEKLAKVSMSNEP